MPISPSAQALANPRGIDSNNLDLWNHILRRLGVLGLAVILHFFPATPPSFAQGITPNSIITTVAGGSWVFRGDGKPAVDAPLGEIRAVHDFGECGRLELISDETQPGDKKKRSCPAP